MLRMLRAILGKRDQREKRSAGSKATSLFPQREYAAAVKECEALWAEGERSTLICRTFLCASYLAGNEDNVKKVLNYLRSIARADDPYADGVIR